MDWEEKMQMYEAKEAQREVERYLSGLQVHDGQVYDGWGNLVGDLPREERMASGVCHSQFGEEDVRVENGLIYDSRGKLIGELPLEEPNFFLDPINYIGGFGGLGYKTGIEIPIAKRFRIAPFGNRTGHKYGKRPHYHRWGPKRSDGSRAPGEGKGRHRPWEGW